MDQSKNANQKLRVGVIGGSITGCAATIVFSRAGHEVAVYERSPHGLTERGAGIGTPVSMLQTLIDQDLLDTDFPHFELSAMPFLGRSSDTDRLGEAAWVTPVQWHLRSRAAASLKG